MDEIEVKAHALLSEAIMSYNQTLIEFGDKWILPFHDSIKAWLHGYNANEHNNKLFNKTLELLDEVKMD